MQGAKGNIRLQLVNDGTLQHGSLVLRVKTLATNNTKL